MIDATNYFEASRGIFRKLPRGVTATFLASVWKDVEWAGRKWEFNFDSQGHSFYWIGGRCLIRVSDHWSRGYVRTQCGNIARCYWVLQGKSRSLKEGCVGGFYGGIVAFKDLQAR